MTARDSNRRPRKAIDVTNSLPAVIGPSPIIVVSTTQPFQAALLRGSLT